MWDLSEDRAGIVHNYTISWHDIDESQGTVTITQEKKTLSGADSWVTSASGLMGGQEYLICLLSWQTLPCLQNTGIQDEETAEHYTMSVNEDEERDISKEIKHQQDTCPVKTLATVSLSVSLTALVISCVFGTLVIVSYFAPDTNVDKIPELCRLPPDPGPCSSSVNRQVIISHGHVSHCPQSYSISGCCFF